MVFRRVDTQLLFGPANVYEHFWQTSSNSRCRTLSISSTDTFRFVSWMIWDFLTDTFWFYKIVRLWYLNDKLIPSLKGFRTPPTSSGWSSWTSNSFNNSPNRELEKFRTPWWTCSDSANRTMLQTDGYVPIPTFGPFQVLWFSWFGGTYRFGGQ